MNPANVFVPFYTTKPQGSGIGLVLSRQIVEAHGGTINVANRARAPGLRGEDHSAAGNLIPGERSIMDNRSSSVDTSKALASRIVSSYQLVSTQKRRNDKCIPVSGVLPV